MILSADSTSVSLTPIFLFLSLTSFSLTYLQLPSVFLLLFLRLYLFSSVSLEFLDLLVNTQRAMSLSGLRLPLDFPRSWLGYCSSAL